MRPFAAFALGLLSIGGAARADCADLERTTAAPAADLGAVMDQAGVLRSVGRDALKALAECPDSPRLWYLAARAAEVLGARRGGPAFAPETAASLAAKAAAHAPKSAEIAALLARETGKPDDARRAYDLNPNYAPARRVYALALVERGDADKALGLVAGRDRLDLLARAQVFNALRRYREAAAAARAAEAAPSAREEEPTLDLVLHRDIQETLGLALLGDGRRREAQAPLSDAAALGSRKARAALDDAR